LTGIAQYYALFLPVRAGLRGANYFHETLDAFLCSYYTNPRINTPLRQAQKEFFDGFYAESIPYMRGFVYILLMDGLTRQGSKELNDDDLTVLDKIVLGLMLRQRQGRRTQSKHWLEAFYPLLGKERVDNEFFGMVAGETVDLKPISSNLFLNGIQLKLRPVQQEVMDFGMSLSSPRTQVVRELQVGSRAELAGLQNGDILLRSSTVGESLSRFERRFHYVVERNGQASEGEYWPRSFDKVASFQLAEWLSES